MEISRINIRNNNLINFINDENTRKLCRNKDEKTFLRDRKLSYKDILFMSLNKQGKTTTFELRDYEIKKKGKENVEYSDEAYLKQRRHLNPEVFKEANKVYLKDFYENDNVILENNYLVCAIDGSTFEVPNTPKNKEHFGYHKNNDYQSTMKARAQVSTIYDLNNNFYLDVQIGRYKSKEETLAKENIKKAKELTNQKLLLIFDRGYPSLVFFNWLEKNEVKFLMRMSKGTFLAETEAMETDDEIITIKYTKARKSTIRRRNKPEDIEFLNNKETKLRVTKVLLSSGEIEYLISNLDILKFNSEEMKKLYNKRWGIETSYNTSKNKLKIESYTGNLPQFVYQDIYAQIIVYNQIQDMIKESNNRLKDSKKKLKYEYKTNENKAIGFYKEQFIKIMLTKEIKERTKLYEQFINNIKNYVIAIRQDRPNQPRLNNLHSKYRTNMKSSF